MWEAPIKDVTGKGGLLFNIGSEPQGKHIWKFSLSEMGEWVWYVRSY